MVILILTDGEWFKNYIKLVTVLSQTRQTSALLYYVKTDFSSHYIVVSGFKVSGLGVSQSGVWFDITIAATTQSALSR